MSAMVMIKTIKPPKSMIFPRARWFLFAFLVAFSHLLAVVWSSNNNHPPTSTFVAASSSSDESKLDHHQNHQDLLLGGSQHIPHTCQKNNNASEACLRHEEDNNLLAIVAEEKLLRCCQQISNQTTSYRHPKSSENASISHHNKQLLRNTTNESRTGKAPSSLSTLVYRLSGVALSMGERHPVIWRPATTISTSIVHRFSPQLNKQIQDQVFLPESNIPNMEMHLLSPGLIRLPSKRFLVVLRIWFNQESSTVRLSENYYTENFMYQQVLSADFSEEEVPGSLVPIAAPSQYSSGGGPSDPRVFTIGDSIFINFYMLRHKRKRMVGQMYLWDETKRRLHEPVIENFRQAQIESNWSPFDFGGHLHYVYMYNPLRIVRCELGGASVALPCRFVFEEPRGGLLPEEGNANVAQLLPNTNALILRGGTPLVHYRTLSIVRHRGSAATLEDQHYYLTAIHSVVPTKEIDPLGFPVKRYNAHFALLRAVPDSNSRDLSSMCVVFISGKLAVNSEVFETSRLVLTESISDSFIFPVGLVLMDDEDGDDANGRKGADCLLLSYHASDDRSFVSKYCGLRALLDPLISANSTCLRDVLTPTEINNHVTRHLL